MAAINVPSELKPKTVDAITDNTSAASPTPLTRSNEGLQDKPCLTFVYAAYLQPGLHQFLIYCPKTKRAFCKDIVIDLNSCDSFPEYPEPCRILRGEKRDTSQRPTRCNVWRKWRVDSRDDIRMAFLADTMGSFDPTRFIKARDGENDIAKCKRELVERFDILNLVYMELLAGSSKTYPEIGWEVFLGSMLDQ